MTLKTKVALVLVVAGVFILAMCWSGVLACILDAMFARMY